MSCDHNHHWNTSNPFSPSGLHLPPSSRFYVETCTGCGATRIVFADGSDTDYSDWSAESIVRSPLPCDPLRTSSGPLFPRIDYIKHDLRVTEAITDPELLGKVNDKLRNHLQWAHDQLVAIESPGPR